jgi:hypothetical protein
MLLMCLKYMKRDDERKMYFILLIVINSKCGNNYTSFSCSLFGLRNTYVTAITLLDRFSVPMHKCSFAKFNM